MKFDVEMTVQEQGLPVERFGYLRDSRIEMESLLAWTKATLIRVADVVLREEQAKGFDKDPAVLVDGRPGKPISSVSPLGRIQFVARSHMKNILIDTYSELLKRSKVRTGRYKASHRVVYNGKQVATDLTSLTAWLATEPPFKDNDIIRIINMQPYARRLETLGVTSQRTRVRQTKSRAKSSSPKLVRKPNGAYHLTARYARRKYGRNLKIVFTYLTGATLNLSGSFAFSKKALRSGRGSRRGSLGRTYLYPSISMIVNEKGIL